MLQVKIDLQNMFTLQANMSKNVPIIDLYDTKSQQSLVKGWEKIMKITSALPMQIILIFAFEYMRN